VINRVAFRYIITSGVYGVFGPFRALTSNYPGMYVARASVKRQRKVKMLKNVDRDIFVCTHTDTVIFTTGRSSLMTWLSRRCVYVYTRVYY